MIKQNVNIRKLKEDDILIIFNQVCELEQIRFDFNVFQNIYVQNINDPHKLYYLAEDREGNGIGFISCHIQNLLHHCGPVAEIQELFIQEAFRGKGIGGLLVAHIEQLLKEAGVLNFEVTAQNKRIQTHLFYENAGLKNTHLKFTKEL